MSEEHNKYSFFKSIKKSLLKIDDSIEEESKVEESVAEVKKQLIHSIRSTEEVKHMPLYKSISNSKYLDERFAENFIHSGGKFVFCEDHKEFFDFLTSLKQENNWNHIFSWNTHLRDFFSSNNFQNNEIGFLLDSSDVAISYCYKLSANEGVIVLSPEQATNRRLVTFPKTHIIIAYKNQLKSSIAEATKGFEQKYGGRLASLLELHKGRPVTKEHHKKLLKAEGPEDVYLFYIDQEEIA